ncbi:hypothetical protein O1611_g5608 [Lasiodiplodia mahajangana]|uniref:Uncharacterized protein n=1 Tax=Lasiodiplodia mahajangana TaxID=1108764 RepID=A0ACC2JKJ2_9PEZI|nr:hypothetical protein O1611_g5608 [Lasiodiplodia mahajangana]
MEVVLPLRPKPDSGDIERTGGLPAVQSGPLVNIPAPEPQRHHEPKDATQKMMQSIAAVEESITPHFTALYPALTRDLIAHLAALKQDIKDAALKKKSLQTVDTQLNSGPDNAKVTPDAMSTPLDGIDTPQLDTIDGHFEPTEQEVRYDFQLYRLELINAIVDTMPLHAAKT